MARVTFNDFNNFLNEMHVFNDFWCEFHDARIKASAKIPDGDPYASYQRFSSLNPIRWVTAAFPWVHSVRGMVFWSDIDDLWSIRVKDICARSSKGRSYSKK